MKYNCLILFISLWISKIFTHKTLLRVKLVDDSSKTIELMVAQKK